MPYDQVSVLLCKVGLLALFKGMDEEGEAILVCARRIAEDPPILDIAHAMIYSLRGDLSSAIDILQNRTLAEFPNHDLAKSVLGMTLKMAKKESWRGLFGEVLASSTDSEARMISSEGLKEE